MGAAHLFHACCHTSAARCRAAVHRMGKRQRASDRAESPLSLYKRAVRLARRQPCGDVAADADIEACLRSAIDLLESSPDTHQAAQVTYSLDLDLADEPLFLLSSSHLQLGKLYQRQDNLNGAVLEYKNSLAHFSSCVEALSALGQVLKMAATSAASLLEAEQLLQKAVDVAQELTGQEGGLLVESNKHCAAAVEAADGARAALAMLLCQAGRHAEAAKHLKHLGYRYSLSTAVLQYPTQQQHAPSAGPHDHDTCHHGMASSASSCSFMQAVDHALPPSLLQHLQHVFRPEAPFWKQHAYGRVGYFSYFFALDQAVTSSMHQLARHLQQVGSEFFPELQEARFAEFWAHCRRHSSGHQLHFDSDDEGQGGVRHPIITAIVYLSSNVMTPPVTSQLSSADAAVHGLGGSSTSRPHSCASCDSAAQPIQGPEGCKPHAAQTWVGGPTLMTDQVLGGPLATQGWLAYPATNRAVFFDGRYLHGVIPGCGPSPCPEGRRTTLMMAFWRDLKCRSPAGTGIGACMAMPDFAHEDKTQWQQEFKPLTGCLGSSVPIPIKQLQHVSAVWQPVEVGTSTTNAAYHSCFQGF